MALAIISWMALALIVALMLLVLFEPPLQYGIDRAMPEPSSAEFCRLVSALADAELHGYGHIEVLTGGSAFYPVELEAIRQAKTSVHIEAFIFHPGAIGDQFLAALIDRATHGVHVKLVADAVGSFRTPDRYFQPLRDAGGLVCWYQPLRLWTLKRFNNRTHRELIIIDGTLGFIGGAGIAEHWHNGDKGKLPWRDMMFRVEGSLVAGLQTTFAENWLESSNRILAEPADFPPIASFADGENQGLVVMSTPTAGRSSRNRAVFQLLLAGARRTIQIHSPYFLPDRSVSAELIKAVRERQVKVQIIVPSKFNNHPFTRLASRRRYGTLLNAGVEIYEYEPGMIHTKTMTVDGLWSAVGSTNFDSRSFDLNDEVNLVAMDENLARDIAAIFETDMERSKRITYDAWRKRSLAERFFAQVGRVGERQE